jgi:cell division protein FtsB
MIEHEFHCSALRHFGLNAGICDCIHRTEWLAVRTDNDAETARLKAENESLTAFNDEHQSLAMLQDMQIEKLRAENERLREALARIAGGRDYIAQGIAERALRGESST